MRHKTVTLILIGSFLLALDAEPSDKKSKVILAVVPTTETELVSQAKSYIGRELRSLRDVEILERDPGLVSTVISIFPFSLKLSNGMTAGMGVSYVFEKDSVMSHGVMTGGPNDLKVLCEKVIAYFDTYWLEPRRKKEK